MVSIDFVLILRNVMDVDSVILNYWNMKDRRFNGYSG